MISTSGFPTTCTRIQYWDILTHLMSVSGRRNVGHMTRGTRYLPWSNEPSLDDQHCNSDVNVSIINETIFVNCLLQCSLDCTQWANVCKYWEYTIQYDGLQYTVHVRTYIPERMGGALMTSVTCCSVSSDRPAEGGWGNQCVSITSIG